MPQFRFRATDSQGKLKAGRLTASSQAEAQQRVEQLGLTVIDVVSVDLVLENSKGGNFKPERVEPYAQLAAWPERLMALLPDGFSGYHLAGLIGILGIVVGLFTWRPGQPEIVHHRARSPIAMADKLFKAKFTGNIAAPSKCRLEDSTVTISFPEIPCQFSERWSALKHPNETEFVWDLEFAAAKKPMRFELEVSAAGFRGAKPDNLVASEAAAANRVDLTLRPVENSRNKR